MRVAQPVELIPGQQQSLWGWPAVVNFALGGLGAGFYVVAVAASGFRPSPVVILGSWLGPLLVLVGFAAVAAEAGRPFRGGRVLSRVATSWMSRELWVGGVFVVCAVADLLSPWRPYRLIALGAGLGLALAQGFILRRARGVISWDVPLIPATFLLSAILIFLVLAATASGAWFYAQSRGSTPRFRTAKVERGPVTATVSTTGTLNAVVTVQVGSQVSGQVKELFADFNSQVKRNQLVARIDPEKFQAAVAQARAQVDSAKAMVLNQRALVEKTRADLANTQAALAVAKAQTAKAQVAVVDSRRTLARNHDLRVKGFIAQADEDTAQATYDSAYKVAWESRRFWEQDGDEIYGGISWLTTGTIPLVWYPSAKLMSQRGVVVAGYDANKVFIENGRYHGDRIVARLLGQRGPGERRRRRASYDVDGCGTAGELGCTGVHRQVGGRRSGHEIGVGHGMHCPRAGVEYSHDPRIGFPGPGRARRGEGRRSPRRRGTGTAAAAGS